MLRVVRLKTLLNSDKTIPLKLRVGKTFIEITKEKSEFTLSLAQWLKAHEMQKYEGSLARLGIYTLEDLHNKRAELQQDKSYEELAKHLDDVKKYKSMLENKQNR